MQAIVRTRYGPPEVLSLQAVARPEAAADEILIQIEATSLNRSDWEGLVGQPMYARFGGLLRPRGPILGSDVAGRVVAAGKDHTRFKVGDEVYGDILSRLGGLAEYVNARGRVMAIKPPELSFEQAAAIPQAGVIALQGLRDKARLQPGQSVLINGAGGGTGMFAVQLAKRAGAEVTGVDNAGKLDYLRALGADHVLDYAQTDFTRTRQQYDFILDMLAYRSPFAYARALKPNGKYYAVGGSIGRFLQMLALTPWFKRNGGKHVGVLVVQPNAEDLATVAALCAAGTLRPVIGARFPLSQTPEALRQLGAGRVNGKIVINVAQPVR